MRAILQKMPIVCLGVLICLLASCNATTGHWLSTVTGDRIRYKISEAASPLKDASGHYFTVVYLENLGFSKLGGNSNAENVRWLLDQGFRVVELDYNHHTAAVSPAINQDIIAINDAIAVDSFCGNNNYSQYRSYVLFEGYRIALDVPYFLDDPTVYNTPDDYVIGDELYMDIVYPADAEVYVPVVLSFSYSNSSANAKNQRLFLPYTLAGFNDSFLEGAPANGMAWAIADHPKYCPWGSGKPVGSRNDTYKSYQTNPDAARKVKSAIRTLRAVGDSLGLSGKIGIYGFSRGADAGSMAVGDRKVPEFENAGYHLGISDEVQAAALGPGVFDFTQIYNTLDDGDKNLEIRCPWAWGPLSENEELWQSMGAAYLVETSATAPVLFFYNTDDSSYYQDQIAHLKSKLDSLEVPVETLINYGKGHSVPQTEASIGQLYKFFKKYLSPPELIPPGGK